MATAKKIALGIAALISLSTCTHFAVEDCAEPGGKVLGEEVSRIRSSHFRMKLADEAAAAARFVPYAAMSALAYAQDLDCKESPKINDQERIRLEEIIDVYGRQGEAKWVRVPAVEHVGACEDNFGLFYSVWMRGSATSVDVVMAFRGTWGMQDWTNANLHWFTKYFKDDQYDRARLYAKRVIDYFDTQPGISSGNQVLRLYATGHSLGGGLAQHVLYSYPGRFVQAIAFAPTSVTGYRDQSVENQLAGCSCDASLGAEARIYRIYDPGEILDKLRIWHKLFFGPHRHIHEVRFDNVGSHSMKGLAFFLGERAARWKKDSNQPWYAGIGTLPSGKSCTTAFEEAQARSCKVGAEEGLFSSCPQ